MPEEKEKPELIKLASFKDLQKDGPDLQLDLDEDAWSYGAPPPKGCYEVKWFPAKDGFGVGHEKKGDDNTLYTYVNLEGRVVNSADWEDAFVPAQVNSRVYRGKSNSTIAGFLTAGGQKGVLEKYKQEKKLTPKMLGYIAEMLLRKEPTIRCEIDWRGSYSYPDPKNPTENVWINVANKYEDFPVDPDDKNKRLHIYTVTGKDGLPHEIRAQVRVTRFLGKGEVYNPGRIITVGKGASNGAVPILVGDDDAPVLVSQPKTVQTAREVVTPTPVVATPVQQSDEESIQLMLADV